MHTTATHFFHLILVEVLMTSIRWIILGTLAVLLLAACGPTTYGWERGRPDFKTDFDAIRTDPSTIVARVIQPPEQTVGAGDEGGNGGTGVTQTEPAITDFYFSVDGVRGDDDDEVDEGDILSFTVVVNDDAAGCVVDVTYGGSSISTNGGFQWTAVEVNGTATFTASLTCDDAVVDTEGLSITVAASGVGNGGDDNGNGGNDTEPGFDNLCAEIFEDNAYYVVSEPSGATQLICKRDGEGAKVMTEIEPGVWAEMPPGQGGVGPQRPR